MDSSMASESVGGSGDGGRVWRGKPASDATDVPSLQSIDSKALRENGLHRPVKRADALHTVGYAKSTPAALLAIE
jgi:hypothetical protein